VDDIDQRVEEKFISLEMAHVEANAERIATNKQVNDLKLEVSHLNRFLERENLVNSQIKSGIFPQQLGADTTCGWSRLHRSPG
jgi:hypothetical protein